MVAGTREDQKWPIWEPSKCSMFQTMLEGRLLIPSIILWVPAACSMSEH